jgi:hypothetical protein
VLQEARPDGTTSEYRAALARARTPSPRGSARPGAPSLL